MFRKNLRVGLLLLLLLVLGGCQAGGMAKDVVFSKETKAGDGIQKANHSNISIQQAEAVEKAEVAFQKYFGIQNIGKSLYLKAALIEDDGILWMNPYWKLSWVGKDAKKPIYSAEIDAQSGEVVLLRHREKWDCRDISREDVLAYQKTALSFIDKFDLVNNAPLSLFEAYSAYVEGVELEFHYDTDKFITLSFNKAGEVTGFRRAQRVAYALQGNDLKINRSEAIKMAQASINKYFGITDTSGLIEDVGLFQGADGQKTWFVYWKNIAPLDGRFVRYGAQIDALSGELGAVEGVNRTIYGRAQKIEAETLRKTADRFLELRNLSGYRFEDYDKNNRVLRYRDKAGSPLQVYIDIVNGHVCFLSFIESK